MSLEQCSVAGCCSVGLQPRAAQRSCESRLPQPTLVRRQPSSRDEHAAERHMRLCRLVFPSQPVQLDYLQIQTFLISNRLDARPLCPIICKKKKKKGTLLQHPPITRKYLAVKVLELPSSGVPPSPSWFLVPVHKRKIGQVRNPTERRCRGIQIK